MLTDASRNVKLYWYFEIVIKKLSNEKHLPLDHNQVKTLFKEHWLGLRLKAKYNNEVEIFEEKISA